MRILIFWESEKWGGVDSHLCELISNWPNPDDSFYLVTNIGNQGLSRISSDLSDYGVTVFEILPFSYTSLLIYLRRFRLGFLFKIPLFILRPLLFFLSRYQLSLFFSKLGDFDVFLADNGGYPAAWGTLSSTLAAHDLRIPKIFLLIHHSSEKLKFPIKLIESYIDRLIASRITSYLFVSNASQASFIKNRQVESFVVDTKVIHNGIKPTLRPFIVPSELSIFNDLRSSCFFLIGMLGRVERYKGHEDSLIAFSQLPLQIKLKTKLVIVGEGRSNEINHLKQLAVGLGILENVVFTGFLKTTSVEIIKKLDLLLMLTRDFEGFGLTVLEAMLNEVPVIATDVGAVGEFFDNSTGVLVRPRSPELVSNEIENLLLSPTNPVWLDRIKNAKLRALSLSDMSSKYASIFHE